MGHPSPSSFGVTQQDIARSLNLSRSTVAQALNVRFQHKLPTETVELVKRKAAELNYYPKRFAKALRQGKAYTIGAVFKLARYYAPHEQMRLLSHTALARGYHLVTIDRGWFEGKQKEEEKFVLESALDGLIFFNLKADQPPRWIDILRERNFPMINIGSDIPYGMDFTYWDIEDAYHELTRHHLHKGSRRLVLALAATKAECRPDVRVVYDRVKGFVSAIENAGGKVSASFTLPEEHVQRSTRRVDAIKAEVLCRQEGEAWDGNVYDYGYRMIERWLRKGEALPDSLLCSNDEMAAGALTACIRHGIAVPERMKISGADDAPFSAYCGIPLTTVSLPHQKIADWAIDRLIARIEGELSPTDLKEYCFETEIVVRSSTASAPHSVLG